MKIEVISDVKQFGPWVSEKIGLGRVYENAAGYGFLVDGQLAGGVLFSDFTGRDIHVHIAIEDARWCSRKYLKFIAEYAFVHCGVSRVSALTAQSNPKAAKVMAAWGSKQEGLLRKYFSDDDDAIVWGLLKEECRFLEMDKDHG